MSTSNLSQEMAGTNSSSGRRQRRVQYGFELNGERLMGQLTVPGAGV
ncbi:MAG TPA: hypothetical protein VMM78_10305 [Thermomicrobiales bacterium]|nr:hypothetical protein [Thermomicrobiales bacterium]